MQENIAIICNNKQEAVNVLEILDHEETSWGNGIKTNQAIHWLEYPCVIYFKKTKKHLGWDFFPVKEMSKPFTLVSSDFFLDTYGNKKVCIKRNDKTLVVKIDYVQSSCPKCGTPMKALWRLNDFYCPNCEK